ncbi:hypothetical protein [Flavobacterium orientale]|uniref:Uncharacterized protein n=1 Tax=Flavobacterium orientale TaxID=1756020 RepID=A0A916Y8G8_9FLAO|nr:hypothetical protein [Flavobacterium orientale]GGD34666.1 hypothetical protein GCM10011343_25690 [Flavobacterium orientale]
MMDRQWKDYVKRREKKKEKRKKRKEIKRKGECGVDYFGCHEINHSNNNLIEICRYNADL